MCKLKSGIILKDRIYISNTDSHTELLKELKIEDTLKNAETLFIRAELSPKDDNVFSLPRDWQFNVDQDILPEWYVADYDKQRFMDAILEWHKTHVFENKSNLKLSLGGCVYRLKNCQDATLWGNSTATLWDNSTATLWDNSTATLRGNSTATLWGNSTATLRGNSTGRLPNDTFSGKKENYILMENSTLKDCKSKVLYQSGGWKFVEVEQ